MATPLSINTTKLTELKNKANDLPDQNPPAQLQEKTVTPTKEGLIVVPDSSFDGMSKVTINGDNNLVPENIKEGVSIFGVEGSNAGGLLELLNLKWLVNNTGKLQYTNISGGKTTLSLDFSDNFIPINDIDLKKDITLDTNSSNASRGFLITISFLNEAFSLDFYDKSFGPIN